MCVLFHKHLSQHGVRSRDQQLLCIFAHPWSAEFPSENAETCCCSVTKWYPTLCNPKDYSTPGSLSFTISRNLLRFISPESVMLSNHFMLCHPFLLLLSISPSFEVFSMSLLFASGGQSIGVSPSASLLLMNIQDWCPLGLTNWISLQSKGLSRVFSNTTVWKHQFFGAQPSLWSNSHIHTWLLESESVSHSVVSNSLRSYGL